MHKKPAKIEIGEGLQERSKLGDETFDFVWSWGVIRHSSSSEAIAREVHRALKPGGEFRVLVYSKRSVTNYLNLAVATKQPRKAGT